MIRSVCAAIFTIGLASSGFAQTSAEARKDASHAVLHAEKVPVLETLPLIEDETASTRRSDEEVIRRLIALAIVAVKGETNDQAVTFGLIAQFNATGYFSPEEQAFIDNTQPSGQDLIDMSWRYEGVHVLLWAMGLYPDIGRPDAIADVPLLAQTVQHAMDNCLQGFKAVPMQSFDYDMVRYSWSCP